ncbi:hypothetical protein AR539_15755 [Arthrobacter sp. EPSL27]|nr:hypothetical protein AR539_15755 [Arthrobacter sp. EPSL27]
MGSPTAGAPTPGAPAAPRTAPEISDAGLAEALRRDLGMTLEEFNAAGQLARTAADALPSLRDLPGYVGISLKDNRILVEGSGAVLQARVDELNGAEASAVFVLVPPAAGPSAEPTADPVPAAAPSAAERVAASTEQLFQAYVREVGPEELQAVAHSNGRYVIRTGGTNAAEAGPSRFPDPQASPAPTAPGAAATASTPPTAPTSAPGKMSAADFVSRYANVQLEEGPPAATEADLFGGEGYVIDASPWRTICSTGFSAFSPAGLPLVLTAGHCAEDGTARVIGVEPPASSVAGGVTAPLPGTLDPLGKFGFSQFGGLSNSWITGTEQNPGNVGTDIAVIEGLDGAINPQPEASTWASAADPGATAVKIIGTVTPFQGQEVCRSGRTTGWSCGQVDETGIYVVGGRTTAPGDLRAFRGFLSNSVQSAGGDSGGPWISGNFAVGTHTAGETSGENFAIATTLADALGYMPDVQLHLFLNKPELAVPAGAADRPGQPITGRVPAAPASAVAANSKVRITVDGEAPVEVPVDADGNWSYRAPEASGPLTLTAETVNGFSRSGAATLAVTVSGAEEPVVTPPAEDVAPVVPAAVPPKAEPAAVPPAEPAAPVLPAASGHLPDTGAGTLLSTAGLAAGAILLGAALLAATRRRAVR